MYHATRSRTTAGYNPYTGSTGKPRTNNRPSHAHASDSAMTEIRSIRQEVTIDQLRKIDVGDKASIEISSITTSKFVVTDKHEYSDHGTVKIKNRNEVEDQ